MDKEEKGYALIVQDLARAVEEAKVTKTVVAELMDVPYITLDKWLRGERGVNHEVTARQMESVTKLLDAMVASGNLPIPKEVNKRLRSQVIMKEIRQFTDRG